MILRMSGSGLQLCNVMTASADNQAAVVAASFNYAGEYQVGAFSATGASIGKLIRAGPFNSSQNVTAAANHLVFYNPNGTVGAINTSASTTVYATTSDERLKDFTGPLSGEDAIAIIRADPVRRFTWKTDGTAAVGWGAQTSYAINPDLASPPPEEAKDIPQGEEGFMPWGIDQGRRTPYLWAALAWALDRIDNLETRLAALEARP